eukprot:374202-Rhodomonas_salina.1
MAGFNAKKAVSALIMPAVTQRNQRQEATLPARFVPSMRFLAFDFFLFGPYGATATWFLLRRFGMA